ncbi:MAG: class I SAM-dependent methyltransferase [Schaedlerella sp.]|nr:class I SAM-dependent methyltransferase [Schaedlerella sp.]
MGIYQWNPEMIQFMNQAAKDSIYYEELASHIIPHITEDCIVCDVGCGLGYLAIEIAKYCKKVYAVDISEDVIDELKKRLKAEQIENVEALCVDAFKWKPEDQIDTTVYCMFGSLEEIDQIGKHLEVSQQFVVRRLAKEHRFKIKEHKPRKHRHSAQGMLEELEQKGRICDYVEMTASLDQPFKNLKEAVRFFELYNKTEEKITLEDVKERLIKQENEEYPYVFPAEKRMGLIHFNMDKIYKRKCEQHEKDF